MRWIELQPVHEVLNKGNREIARKLEMGDELVDPGLGIFSLDGELVCVIESEMELFWPLM